MKTVILYSVLSNPSGKKNLSMYEFLTETPFRFYSVSREVRKALALRSSAHTDSEQ